MIARLWRTGIKPGCGQDYERFARDVSLAMFREQPGFLGCIMARSLESALVLTMWQDQEAADALEQSPTYRATVARILETGFLEEPQSVDAAELHLMDIARLPDSV